MNDVVYSTLQAPAAFFETKEFWFIVTVLAGVWLRLLIHRYRD